MTNPEAAQLAALFLAERRIAFEEPAHVHAGAEGLTEVIFSSPGALDPLQVVDPPDVRVRVFTLTGRCGLVVQM